MLSSLRSVLIVVFFCSFLPLLVCTFVFFKKMHLFCFRTRARKRSKGPEVFFFLRGFSFTTCDCCCPLYLCAAVEHERGPSRPQVGASSIGPSPTAASIGLWLLICRRLRGRRLRGGSPRFRRQATGGRRRRRSPACARPGARKPIEEGGPRPAVSQGHGKPRASA